MADEFQMGSGNWWDTSRTRFDTGSSTPSSTALNSVGSFGWPAEMVDIKSRSGMAAASASDSAASSAGGGGVLADPNLQFMGLGLSSQGLDWNQSLLRGEKSETSFRSILQEDLNSSTNFQQQDQWRQKSIYSGSSDDSSMNEFKQINRGFSLDEPQFSTSHMSSGDSTVTCHGLATSFQVDSAAAAVYGGSTSNMLQGFFGSDNLYGSNYGMGSGEMLPTNWPKFSQILRNSPPKQPPPPQQPHLHFSNNAPFWNASAAAMNDVRSSFFPPSAPTPFPTTTFDEKPKIVQQNTSEMSTVAKKSSNETSNKRARNETPSPLPAFKVRKEKMGDRITALQQLVSPFGKTDTASVLSEAIEYIKFLHEQVLSNPYMKNGAPMQQPQQHTDKSKDPEGQRQDLRSRGLCLVPVSSTFPVTHETTVDFWTPTFGR